MINNDGLDDDLPLVWAVSPLEILVEFLLVEIAVIPDDVLARW